MVLHMKREERQNQFARAVGTGTSFARDDEQMEGTIPMPMFARRPSTMSSYNTGGNSAEPYGWTAKTAKMGAAIRQIPYSTSTLQWKIRFKNQVTTYSDFPSDTMLWINEVEMVEFKSSRSVLHDDNVQEFDARWDEVLLTFYVKDSIR